MSACLFALPAQMMVLMGCRPGVYNKIVMHVRGFPGDKGGALDQLEKNLQWLSPGCRASIAGGSLCRGHNYSEGENDVHLRGSQVVFGS